MLPPKEVTILYSFCAALDRDPSTKQQIANRILTHTKNLKKMIYCISSGLNKPCTIFFLLFCKKKFSYWKQNVNSIKGVGKDWVFLGLASLLLGISHGLRPLEIPRPNRASLWKTLSIPPLLLGSTQTETVQTDYEQCEILLATHNWRKPTVCLSFHWRSSHTFLRVCVRPHTLPRESVGPYIF